MSQSTATVVREINAGATLATLATGPWPVSYRQAPVQGYTLAGVPVRASIYTVSMAWGYLPNSLLTALWALPTNRLTEWFLPTPGPSGTNQVWGWVRGALVRPDGDVTAWTRQNWDASTWTLAAATIL